MPGALLAAPQQPQAPFYQPAASPPIFYPYAHALQALQARAAEEGLEVAVVSAKVESELMELPREEAQVG